MVISGFPLITPENCQQYKVEFNLSKYIMINRMTQLS